MDKKQSYTTIKIWTKTLRQLRMIYAITGERMVVILDRLVNADLKKQKEVGNETLSSDK